MRAARPGSFVIFLAIVFFFVLEIYVLIEVWAAYGFVNTAFALLLGAFLGAGIAKAQGRYILRHLQSAVTQSKMPSDQILHGMLIFIAGLLFLIPGFVSDALGLLLLLPGTRHLAVILVKRHFRQQVLGGKFRVFTFGAGPGGAFGGAFRRSPQGDPRARDGWTRDVTPKIIDVTPHRPRTPPDHPDDSKN